MPMENDMCPPIPVVSSIAELSEGRKAWFCDVWGVLHDGLTAFEPAVDACRAFKARGGEIVLVSNSPRPSGAVLKHLSSLGVRSGSFNALVTSGDVTRGLVEAHAGEGVFHLGPERDLCLFEGLNVAFAPPEKAVAAVCTGFFHEDRETPEDYDAILAALAARGVPMICANPDLAVERGNRLLPCAGLLAERYAALGQTVIQAGKPYRPIYDAAMRKLSIPLARKDILAIGDGIDTDIKGAHAQGIDSVYIASRVHYGDRARLDGAAGAGAEGMRYLGRLFAGKPFRPAAAMSRLRW